MKFSCDRCGKYLGDYLYGNGGVEERAVIVLGSSISIPDIICNECYVKNPTIKKKMEEGK